MVVKFVKDGIIVRGPPYTKAEEADFYRHTGGGPVTVVRPADDRKGQKSRAAKKCAELAARKQSDNAQ